MSIVHLDAGAVEPAQTPSVPGPRPVAIDLYAGAGGLSLGMEQAGFDVIAAAEFDPVHALTHRFNFPRTPVVCADLSAVSAADLRSAAEEGWRASGREGSLGEIDAVVGGPPCQGFSVGGVRDIDDPRNSQLLRFVDLVVELAPRSFCLENVGGLLESRFDAVRTMALERLVGAGYRVSGFDHVVNASNHGVPQSRKRVLVVGSRRETPVVQEVSGVGVSVADAFGGLPEPSRYRRLLRSDVAVLTEPDCERMIADSTVYGRQLLGLDWDYLDLSPRRSFNPQVLTNSLRTVHARGTTLRFQRTPPGSVEKVSRLYRLSDAGVSRTLRAGTGTDRGSHTSPRPIHPSRPRVITVREAARLHGYPDWFRFNATNWHGHRQVGNSVPPRLAAAAGRALVRALGISVSKPNGVTELGDARWLYMGAREARMELQLLARAISFEKARVEVGSMPV